MSKAVAKPDDDLNDKQALFCHEYLKDLNGKQAAIRAGYSEKSAQTTSSDLLSYPKVQARVQQLADSRALKVKINAETILKELLNMATADITDAFTDEGWMKPLKDIPPELRKCISALEVHELFDGQGDDKHIIGVNKRVKFYDKTKALELLGKHLKLFIDKVELDGDMSIRVILEDYISKKDAG